MPTLDACRTLGDCLAFQARRVPDRTALEFKQQRLSYRALWDAARACAGRLQREGIGRGDRVAFLGRNSDLYFIVLFGCSLRGAAFLPLNWRLAGAELQEVLADAQPALLLADTDFADALGDGSQSARCQRFSIDPRSGTHDLADWLSVEPLPLADPVDGNDIAALVYTSGTTGRPKGAMLPHAACIARRRAEQQAGAAFRWDAADERVLAALPMFHVGGLNAALMGLYQGATVCVLDQARIEDLVDEIAARRITRALIVPTLLGELLALPPSRAQGLLQLRTILYGSAPIAPALLARALETWHCDMVQLFGMTEATGSCCWLAPEDHDPRQPHRLLSIGKPFPGLAIEVRDGQGRVAAAGEVGELWVQGPTLMRGYWQRPADTDAVLQDGWYRSGDAGYLDADGYLYLTDRIKDMIVSGGENVYPAEVERQLLTHPAVREVAVIGVPHPKWGEAVHAVVVKRAGSELTAEELLAYARRLLAGYKLPKSVEFSEALPRNALGKVLKPVLRAPYWANQGRSIA